MQDPILYKVLYKNFQSQVSEVLSFRQIFRNLESFLRQKQNLCDSEFIASKNWNFSEKDISPLESWMRMVPISIKVENNFQKYPT